MDKPTEEPKKTYKLEEVQDIVKSYQEEFASNEKNDIAPKCEAILTDSAEAIAHTMVGLALNSTDERVQFNAARYVMDNLVFPRTGREGGREDFGALLERIKANQTPQ